MSRIHKNHDRTGPLCGGMSRPAVLGGCRRLVTPIVILLLFALIPIGCGPSLAELSTVEYAPQAGGDWKVSDPETQGLDPMDVALLYHNASRVETTYSVLVVKDGYLIAEKYFDQGSIAQKARLQSATKSFTSALVGLALEKGYLSSLDQKMVDFFPELAGRIGDPRKNEITIRQMLQMRAGYPWEESTDELFEMLYSGFRPSLLVDVPLAYDPGNGFEYSNLTSHLLGVIVARATGTDLLSFAQQNLFSPLGIEAGEWIKDWEGYYNGHGDLHLTARDMAKFGLLYLNGGTWEGRQVIPEAWVLDSLQTYTEDAWDYKVGGNFTDLGYGYQWWSAWAGGHRFNFAWGHGGQQIALVEELGMVIVVTADPLVGEHGGGPWSREKANLNLVGDFVRSLFSE